MIIPPQSAGRPCAGGAGRDSRARASKMSLSGTRVRNVWLWRGTALLHHLRHRFRGFLCVGRSLVTWLGYVCVYSCFLSYDLLQSEPWAMHEGAAPRVGLGSFQNVCNIIYIRVVVGSKVAQSLFIPQATSELCAQFQRCFV